MLNKNKIESLIYSGNSNPSIVSRETGMNYQTLNSKIKSGSWTPDDIEIFADYFQKPLTYFFDKEDKEAVIDPKEDKMQAISGTTQVSARPYAQLEQHNQGNDPKMTYYTCQDCIEKERTIQAQKKTIETQEKLIVALEGFQQGKNGKAV